MALLCLVAALLVGQLALPSVALQQTLHLHVAGGAAASTLQSRSCTLHRRSAEELGRSVFDVCNSVRAKDFSFINIRRQPQLPSECTAFAEGGCKWTANYSCPGQRAGSVANATDDGTLGFKCCCAHSLWQQMSAVSEGTQQMTANFARGSNDNSQKQVVWVSGYPRSGSSTMLSLVSAASGHEDARTPGQTFSLFEPCHNGDEVSPVLEVTGCMGLLGSISNCEFSGVSHLWGWPDPHSTNNKTAFSNETASRICKRADVIAFKTVDFAHDLKKYEGMLDADPRLTVLDVVRDPRGIWASWKTTEPFSELLKQGAFYTLSDICESFASNLELAHPRVKHVVFEELVANPLKYTQSVYKFMGLPFEEAQKAWVNRTFDAKECPPPPPGIPEDFTDCHKDSHSNAEKWRSVLSLEELANFDANPACQKVVQHYGFPSS